MKRRRVVLGMGILGPGSVSVSVCSCHTTGAVCHWRTDRTSPV